MSPSTGPHRRDVLAYAFITAVLLPHLVALVAPFQSFPITSAPMFANYVDADTPRYRFRFVAEGPSGAEWELQPRDIGYLNVEFGRFFFSVYGSVGPGSASGYRKGETREDFEARVTEFFGRFAAAARRLPDERASFAEIRLDLVRLTSDNLDAEAREVGRYHVGVDRFVHTWGSEE
jgi:hypothetical protein